MSRNKYMRDWKKRNKGYVNALARKYRKRPERRAHDRRYLQRYRAGHPESVVKGNKAANDKRRTQVIAGYGGACECCGETEPAFLTIDHPKNDGARDRKRIRKAGVNLYARLIKLGFPRNRYRLMCFNCNCGRARNGGVCPHKKGK